MTTYTKSNNNIHSQQEFTVEVIELDFASMLNEQISYEEESGEDYFFDFTLPGKSYTPAVTYTEVVYYDDLHNGSGFITDSSSMCCGRRWSFAEIVERMQPSDAMESTFSSTPVSASEFLATVLITYESIQVIGKRYIDEDISLDCALLMLKMDPVQLQMVVSMAEQPEIVKMIMVDIYSCQCFIPESDEPNESLYKKIPERKWRHDRKCNKKSEIQFSPTFYNGSTNLDGSYDPITHEDSHSQGQIKLFTDMAEYVFEVASEVDTVISWGAFPGVGQVAAASAFPDIQFYFTDLQRNLKNEKKLPQNVTWFERLEEISYEPRRTMFYADAYTKSLENSYEMGFEYAVRVGARFNSLKYIPSYLQGVGQRVENSRLDTQVFQRTNSGEMRERIDRTVDMIPMKLVPFLNGDNLELFASNYNRVVRNSVVPYACRLTRCSCHDCFVFNTTVKVLSSRMCKESVNKQKIFLRCMADMQRGYLFSMKPTVVNDFDIFGEDVDLEAEELWRIRVNGGLVRLMTRHDLFDVYCPPYSYMVRDKKFVVKVNGQKTHYSLTRDYPYVLGSGIGSLPIGLYYHAKAVLGVEIPIIDDGDYRVVRVEQDSVQMYESNGSVVG
jgi:hypothetical protein